MKLQSQSGLVHVISIPASIVESNTAPHFPGARIAAPSAGIIRFRSEDQILSWGKIPGSPEPYGPWLLDYPTARDVKLCREPDLADTKGLTDRCAGYIGYQTKSKPLVLPPTPG
jgi:hypothetical protein